MERLKIMGIIACVGLLLAPAAFAGGPKGPPGGLGVEIVNPLPLPVKGKVKIKNAIDDPIPVQIVGEEGPTPYQGSFTFLRVGTGDPNTTSLKPEIGAGQILTIEYISGNCYTNIEILDFAGEINTVFQETEFRHILVADSVTTKTNQDPDTLRYAINQKTTIFADTDYPIEPGVWGFYLYPYPGDTAVFNCRYVISGYLNNSQ